MQLRSIRGGSEKALRNKEYNIGVGISLGNKWFTANHIRELVQWALAHTKEFVVVYVADGIHAINIEVRRDKSPEAARKRALKLGDEKLAEIRAALADLPEEERAKVHFARWDDFTNGYREKVDYLYNKYENELEFRNTILGIVRDFVAHEERDFSEEEIEKLGTYIVEELPEIATRIPAKGMAFEAYTYPFDSEVTELAEDVQLGKRFPEIRDAIMDTAPRVFLEVR